MASYPRYGWRIWVQSPADGRLFAFVSAIHGLNFDLDELLPTTAVVTARCPEGHTPPAPRCACGIHYVADTRAFTRAVQSYCDDSGVFNIAPELMVATYGLAEGRVLPDRNVFENWGGAHPFRASSYRITGMLTDPRNGGWRELERRYRVPVRTGGINHFQATQLVERKPRLREALDRLGDFR